MDIKKEIEKREKNPTFSYRVGKIVGNIASILIGAIFLLFLLWVLMSLGAAVIPFFI